MSIMQRTLDVHLPNTVQKVRKQNTNVGKFMEKTMKSTKFYNFNKRDREHLNKMIRDTLKDMEETGKQANEYTIHIDLTDESIAPSFKYFDSPNFKRIEGDNNFYFVRPEEQTAPQRQTQVYQLECLLDILKGAVKPKSTFVVKTDLEYDNKIYVYDGQHRLLLVFNLMYANNSFMIEALEMAFDNKRVDFPNEKEWPAEWITLSEFITTYDSNEFNYQDLLKAIPELKDTFTNQEVIQVKGDLHLCDSKTANLLFKKLNEQVSGHSTTQRVKADLVGTKFNKLMFTTELKLTKHFEGYLSDLVPTIGLFNHGLEENKKTTPSTFGYNLTNLDKQETMNMDQFLIYVYQLMLCRIKKVNIMDDGDVKQVYKFDKNVKLIDSEFNAPGDAHTGSGAWSSNGIKDSTYEFWMDRFANLEIEDDKEFTEYLRDILEVALIVNNQNFSSVAERWNDKLKSKMKQFNQVVADIDKNYPGENWKVPSDNVPSDIFETRQKSKFAADCIWQYRLANKDQFIVIISFALSSKMAKFKLEDWMAGFLETMISNFQNDWNGNETHKRTYQPSKPRGTKRRITFQSQNYSNNTFFPKMVSEYLEAVDTSLWKRYEATEKYIRETLDHSSDSLYKCPHTCEWVTVDDFQSHHLHFRSEGDANKLFKYWFPLSPKFNNHISDDHEKNIVDVKSDGGFIDACETIINMMEIKKNSTSDKKEIAEWKKSIRTIQSWIDQAEIYFDGQGV